MIWDLYYCCSHVYVAFYSCRHFLINLKQNVSYFPLICNLEEQSSKSTALSKTREQQCNVFWDTNQERGMLALCLSPNLLSMVGHQYDTGDPFVFRYNWTSFNKKKNTV